MGRQRQAVPKRKAKSVLEWIAAGRTLREWCRIPGNPCYATVYDWKDKDPDFNTRFARARRVGEELIAQECLAIADTPQPGEVTAIEHRKLQIDTRLKLLARWNPTQYGERLNAVHSGRLTLEELVCGDDDGSTD